MIAFWICISLQSIVAPFMTRLELLNRNSLHDLSGPRSYTAPYGWQATALQRLTLGIYDMDTYYINNFVCSKLTYLVLVSYETWPETSRQALCFKSIDWEIFPVLEKLTLWGFALPSGGCLMEPFTALTWWAHVLSLPSWLIGVVKLSICCTSHSAKPISSKSFARLSSQMLLAHSAKGSVTRVPKLEWWQV